VSRGVDWETLVAVLTLMLLVLLASMVFVMGVSHAAACLSIDVPPQAVLGNYDGDTFTIFSMQPGGQVKIRVEGVDTPEVIKHQPLSLEAKEFTRNWLAVGTFQLATCGKYTIDRIVGRVTRNGRSLAQDLRDAGLGK
jgi:endonuclease YncB( thermonuclease family)